MAETPVGMPPETVASAAIPCKNGNGHAAPTSPGCEMVEVRLQSRSRSELLQRLSPPRKAIYERIQGLRQAIGASPIDIAKSLRELREHA